VEFRGNLLQNMTERELLKILSVNVKEQRRRLRWSQAELAEKVDISINFLSDIETGKKWASPNTMVKFANVFDIEAYELLKPIHAVVSETTVDIFEKYTQDIHNAVRELYDRYFIKLKQD
jgi:transcriptional regulator with XRE-family HTH domain